MDAYAMYNMNNVARKIDVTAEGNVYHELTHIKTTINMHVYHFISSHLVL